MRMINDPFRRVIRIVRRHYPKTRAAIHFVDKRDIKGCAGRTVWSKAHAIPTVVVSADIPVWGAVDVLAHELAHVVAGHKAKHGPRWKRVFRLIHEEWMKENAKALYSRKVDSP